MKGGTALTRGKGERRRIQRDEIKKLARKKNKRKGREGLKRM